MEPDQPEPRASTSKEPDVEEAAAQEPDVVETAAQEHGASEETPQEPEVTETAASQEPEVTETAASQERKKYVHNSFTFQEKLFMLLLHRGISQGYSFKLSGMRKFEDLVLSFVKDNQVIVRVFQVTQKLDPKWNQITLGSVASESTNDVSLLQAFLIYRHAKQDELLTKEKIQDITICTNVNFREDILKSLKNIKKIEIEDSILCPKPDSQSGPVIYQLTSDYLPRLRLKLKKFCMYYRFKQATDAEMIQFLEHFRLAVNWPHENELGKMIKEEIGKEYDFPTAEATSDGKFFLWVDEWLQSNRYRRFLNPEDGKELFIAARKKFLIWFDVKYPIESFIGREKELTELDHLLTADSEGSPYVCVTGTGGIGKSELARKYISQHCDYFDCNVVWINAKTTRSMEDSFRRLAANKLAIDCKEPDGSDKEIGCIVAEVYQFFSCGKSIFVFDESLKCESENDDDIGIAKFLPFSPPGIHRPHILITSRNQKWPEYVKVLKLQAFQEEESITFINSALDCGSDKFQFIKTLANELQYYPLSLQLAVAYIKNEKSVIKSYIEKYREKSEKRGSFKIPAEHRDRYTRSLLRTCYVTLETIAQKEYGYEAVKIFNGLAYMLPGHVSFTICTGLIANAEALMPALSLLSQYSLITVENEEVSLCRVVQEVTRIRLAWEGKELDVLRECLLLFVDKLDVNNLDHAISVWLHAFKNDNLLQEFCLFGSSIIHELLKWYRNIEAIAYGEKICKRLTAISSDEKVIRAVLDMINTIGGALSTIGHHHKIFKKFLDRLSSSMKVGAPAQHPAMLVVRTNIAYLYHSKGEYKEALNDYKEIINIQKQLYGENHPNTLQTKVNMASTMEKLGLLAECEQLRKEIDESQKMNDECVEEQINRAVANIASGQYSSALDTLRTVLDAEEKRLDPSDRHILLVKLHIGEVLRQLGRTNEALDWLKGVLEVKGPLLGEADPDVLSLRSSIASLLRTEKRFDEASKIYNEIYIKQSQVLGPEHPSTLETLFNKGLVYNDLGKHNESDKIFKEVLIKFKIAFGRDHPITLSVRIAVADVYIRKNKFTEGLKQLRDILNLQESKLGPAHPHVLVTKHKIGRVFAEKGDLSRALNVFKDVLNYRKTVLGKEHPETVAVMADVSSVQFKRGEYDVARSVSEEILNIQKATQGMNSPETLNTLFNIGTIQAYKRNFDKALEIYQEVLDHRKVVLGADHPCTLTVTSAMTELHFGQSEYDKTLEKLYELLRVQENALGENHSQVMTIRRKINLVKDIKERYDNLLKNVDIFKGSNPTKKDGNRALELYTVGLKIERTLECGLEHSAYIPKPSEPLQQAKDYLEGFMRDHDISFSEAQQNAALLTLETGANSARTAIRSNNVVELTRLINQGVDINAFDTKLWTLLHHAVNSGNVAIVKKLLELGADITRVNNKGKSCLHIATLKGFFEIVSLLIDHAKGSVQSFVNLQTTVSLISPLHTAAEKGYYDIVICLLWSGALYNVRNAEGKTPLELSTDEKVIDVLQALDVMFEDVRNGRIQCISLLSGVIPEWFSVFTNARNDQGLTLLQTAIVGNHKEISQRLLKIIKH